MPTQFSAARFAPVRLLTQEVTINPIAVQAVTQTDLQRPVAATPVKHVDFHQALVSLVVLNLNKNGPVVTGGAVPFYNDRFDANRKWYFPEFVFHLPKLDSFRFTCYISGVDADGNHTYSGEVSFQLHKAIPADVTTQTQNNPAATFTEIPLSKLSFNFTVSLADKSTLSFPCTFVQNDTNLTLTIKLDQQDGLIRFYKFISDPLNKDYCSIEITASYFGYTQKRASIKWQAYRRTLVQNQVARMPRAPTIGLGRLPGTVADSDDTDKYITNDAMPLVKTIAGVNFDCHEFPNNYQVRSADNSTMIFGCKPPFGDRSLAKTEYNKFHIINGSLDDTGVSVVYINVYNGNYLVIPKQYQIALDETDGNTLIPAAYLFTKIDADNPLNSTATFKFNIAPAISGFQLLLLKKLLLQNIPASLNKTLDDVFIEFPARIHQPELIHFDRVPNTEIAMMGDYPHGVRSCKFFSLDFQNVNIGNADAAFIANMLKRPEGKMTQSILFEVDSDTDANPQSSLELSLNNITGKGLKIRQDTGDNLVYLINKTLLTISASKLADKNDEPKSLEPAVSISPNQAVGTNAISDVTEIPFTEFQYNYQVGPDYRDKILKEIRTDAQNEVKDAVIVTNNTGLFTLHHIDHIDFVLSIVNPAESDPLYTTNVISLATDGAVTFIDFVLPVGRYFSKWSVAYSTVIHFQDNSVQRNDPQLIDDINSVGKLINLTVLSLHLPTS